MKSTNVKAKKTSQSAKRNTRWILLISIFLGGFAIFGALRNLLYFISYADSRLTSDPVLFESLLFGSNLILFLIIPFWYFCISHFRAKNNTH